jgi:hypothetical protein
MLDILREKLKEIKNWSDTKNVVIDFTEVLMKTEYSYSTIQLYFKIFCEYILGGLYTKSLCLIPLNEAVKHVKS